MEGAEVDVLAGAQALLMERGVSWLIETHSQMLEEQCIDCLANAGYETHIIPNAWWRKILPERRPLAHNRWLFARKELVKSNIRGFGPSYTWRA